MEKKPFFKSTAFRCFAALLIILLVCGVFLTIAHGFLEVTEDERLDRAINKIYGKDVEKQKIDLDGRQTEFSASVVKEAYAVDDGNYLIKVAGKQGYGGDVVCWVVVEMGDDGNIRGVMKIAIDSAPGESYVGNIDQSELDRLAGMVNGYDQSVGGDLHGGIDPGNKQGKDYFATGASRTMWAISNAVNGALDFVAAYALEMPYGGVE